MSILATLLQKEIGDADLVAGRIPAFVFGLMLLFEFSGSDENALKVLFQEFFAVHVLVLVMNKARNHYIIVEVDWFGLFVTVSNSAYSKIKWPRRYAKCLFKVPGCASA